MRNKVFIALAAMMALAATSCQKEEAASAIQFTASAEPTQGKVFYNQNGLFWNSAAEIDIHPLGWEAYNGPDDPDDLSFWYLPSAVYHPSANAPYAQSTALTFEKVVLDGEDVEGAGALTPDDGPFLATIHPAWAQFVDDDCENITFDKNNRIFRVTTSSWNYDGSVEFSNGNSVNASKVPMVAYSESGSSSNNLFFYHLYGVVHVNITLPAGYNLSDYADIWLVDEEDVQMLAGCTYDVTFNANGTLNTITQVETPDDQAYGAYTFNLNDCNIFVNPGTYSGLTFKLEGVFDWDNRRSWGFKKTMKSGATLTVDRAGITTVNITFTEDDSYEVIYGTSK